MQDKRMPMTMEAVETENISNPLLGIRKSVSFVFLIIFLSTWILYYSSSSSCHISSCLVMTVQLQTMCFITNFLLLFILWKTEKTLIEQIEESEGFVVKFVNLKPFTGQSLSWSSWTQLLWHLNITDNLHGLTSFKVSTLYINNSISRLP